MAINSFWPYNSDTDRQTLNVIGLKPCVATSSHVKVSSTSPLSLPLITNSSPMLDIQL